MKRVVLLGKPNVGKSSLLNILVRRHVALVSRVHNATRDVNPQPVHSRGKWYTVMDLGGLTDERAPLLSEVQKKITESLDQADLILAVFDVHALDAEDQKVIGILRKSNTPYLVIANKVDHENHEALVADLYAFGFKNIFAVSCQNKRKITLLRDALHDRLFSQSAHALETKKWDFSLAIVGRPNVGKSSLFSCLLGKDRAIISALSGTTRDTVFDEFSYRKYSIHLLDTAGLRRKSRRKEEVEDLSVDLALGAIRQCNLCLLILDAEQGLTQQDKKIASVADHRGTPLLMAVNKWDKIKDRTWKQYQNFMYRDFPLLRNYPSLAISCRNGKNLNTLKENLIRLHQDANVRFSTFELNELIEKAMIKHPPKGRRPLKIYYAVQAGTNPPRFKFFVNALKELTKNYHRYLEQTIMEVAGIRGVPLQLEWVEKNEKESKPKETKGFSKSRSLSVGTKRKSNMKARTQKMNMRLSDKKSLTQHKSRGFKKTMLQSSKGKR